MVVPEKKTSKHEKISPVSMHTDDGVKYTEQLEDGIKGNQTCSTELTPLFGTLEEPRNSCFVVQEDSSGIKATASNENRRAGIRWFPSVSEQDDTQKESWNDTLKIPRKRTCIRRSLRRRIFLFMTEPESSTGSTVFFSVLILTIGLSNIVMIMQTMEGWQFSPNDCKSCGGNIVYEDEKVMLEENGILRRRLDSCVCPPVPLPITNHVLDWAMYALAIEWIIRVLVYSPSTVVGLSSASSKRQPWLAWTADWSIWIDALAIFPYFLEFLPNGFVSLRLLRFIRRTWKYHDGRYQFVRVGVDGTTEEPSPFTSIHSARLFRNDGMFGHYSLQGASDEIHPFQIPIDVTRICVSLKHQHPITTNRTSFGAC